jgi:hypothetical protein
MASAGDLIMEKKNPVPSIAFDPAKHVIAGRRVHDGKQLFFSLASIVAAENQIENAPQPQAVPDVTQDDLERIEKKVLAAIKASIPPPQFPVDVMGALQDAAAALIKANSDIAALTARVQALEGTVAVHSQNFQTFKEITGAPV